MATWNAFLRPRDLEGGVLPESDPFCRAEQTGLFLETLTPEIDFVGLQEMLDPELQADLIAAAPSYSFSDGPRPSETERDGPRGIQPGGLTALARDTLSVGETYAKGYSECQGTDCLANKGIFYLPLSFGEGGEVGVHMAVTHLQAAGGEVPAEQVRASQFEEIHAALEERVCGNDGEVRPVILLGDLNTPYVGEENVVVDNSEYDAAREILSLSCLGAPLDVFDGQADTPGSFNCFGGQLTQECDEPPVSVRVDHIWYWPADGLLALEKASVEAGAIDGCETAFASDHRLVRASFALKR